MGERKDERFKSDLKIQLDRGEGTVRDVSASGIYFVTEVALKVGEPLKFTLEFQNPDTGPLSAHCIGRIVRIDKQKSASGVAASIDSIEFRRLPKPSH
jgi:hypothetical protein